MEAMDAYQEGLKHDPNNQQLKSSLSELEAKLSKNFCSYLEYTLFISSYYITTQNYYI